MNSESWIQPNPENPLFTLWMGGFFYWG